VPVSNHDSNIQLHTSWSFCCVHWVEVKGDCSLCWICEIVDHHCLNFLITWSEKHKKINEDITISVITRSLQRSRKWYFKLHGWYFLTHFHDVVMNSRGDQCLLPLTFWVCFRSSEVYSIQHYVIKFVSDLRQVGGFLQVLWFHPPINLTATI
jgi:hypothetical protein